MMLCRSRKSRGFTIIELVTAVGLIGGLVILVFGALASLRRTTGMAGRGSIELAAATAMAERFRLDVRQATGVRIGLHGASLTLTGVSQLEASGLLIGPNDRLIPGPGSTVIYAWDDHGHILRKVDDFSIKAGPSMFRAVYSMRELPGGARLVEARWYCAADLAGESVPDEGPAPVGDLLVLDAMLGCSMEDSKP